LLQAVPEIKRVRVAVVGKGWSTIIGPPSVLNKFLTQCPAVKSLPRQETNIRALFHSLTLSELEMAELLGSSSLLDHPAGSCPWKSVVQTACEQILTRPCNIVETVEDLNHRLASVKNVDLNIIGISAHESFIVEQLRATGKNVVVRHEHSIPSSPSTSIPDSSRKIAIVGMAGRSPGAHNLAEFWRIIVTAKTCTSSTSMSSSTQHTMENVRRRRDSAASWTTPVLSMPDSSTSRLVRLSSWSPHIASGS
jgi:zearalenone synthase (nonreducing iterative type I polyketide synthase)